ncbi:RNA-binding S4 domain-containing protein [Luteipulveratus sp. YIM 133132]|uniref:RNA-binding S4 domain-containing protein n=1 Tax=Luteipulveratus flavus TaxID=3031728 RepID=UPI0023AE883F|nr:RNA-binding S4 domain-containing protein [Luteipulveratus sp. YIM 133132]MDE9367176.1 RNA-binding S4 domain-containing protein [Luteipulveratus sp. YIM 133132]
MATEPAIDVPIRDEAIRLGQLLKLSGLVEDGAQARELIQTGRVLVDGEVETRRAHQVRPGSRVELPGAVMTVVRSDG